MQNGIPAEFQWIVGILLAVIAYFAAKTYEKIETIEKNLTDLIVSHGIEKEKRIELEKKVEHVSKKIGLAS